MTSVLEGTIKSMSFMVTDAVSAMELDSLDADSEVCFVLEGRDSCTSCGGDRWHGSFEDDTNRAFLLGGEIKSTPVFLADADCSPALLWLDVGFFCGRISFSE